MEKGGYVYILSSRGRRLYTGVTAHLQVRVAQHKSKADPSCFTARYNIDRLVYYEHYADIAEAIARETMIKNMHRSRKIEIDSRRQPALARPERAVGQACSTVR